eukprot:scaffold30287_cov13-Cyclotella_meneghiniana.AAC.1
MKNNANNTTIRQQNIRAHTLPLRHNNLYRRSIKGARERTTVRTQIRRHEKDPPRSRRRLLT